MTMAKGAEKNSVMPMKTGIVTRAVLYDIARLKGGAVSRAGGASFPTTWRRGRGKAGVRVGPGDALVLRWGRYGRRAQLGPEEGAVGLIIRSLHEPKQR